MKELLLYSFRNCPFCQRARIALYESGKEFTIHEVNLPHKPQELLKLSPKGTVPVLLIDGKKVIDESIDIVIYALSGEDEILAKEEINQFTHDLKDTLMIAGRAFRMGNFTNNSFQLSIPFIEKLELKLANNAFLQGERISTLDSMIMPFASFLSEVKEMSSFPKTLNWLTNVKMSKSYKLAMDLKV